MRFSFPLIGVLFFSSSCSLWENRYPDVWVGEEIKAAPPMRDMLAQVEWAFLEAGFPPGFSDAGSMEVISGWDVASHPFSGQGVRSQAIVKLRRGKSSGAVYVDVKVEVQVNKEVLRPLDIKYAQWEDTADDDSRARIVLMHIKTRLEGDVVDGGKSPIEPWNPSGGSRSESDG